MAENLDDGEFWLPSQFLADDDATLAPFDAKCQALNPKNGDDAVLFPSEFPYGFFPSSEIPSPVDSLVGGSSETESDDDDQLVAELTRRMARSSLQVHVKSPDNALGRFVSGSPQSTLCSIGSGCGCGKGSSQGSPNGVCNFSSARATWDLLHAAAGEVERMRLSQEGYVFNHHNHNGGLFVPQRKPSPVTPLPSKSSDVGLFTQHSLSHHQLQIAQFQMLRQQQMTKQQNSVWNVQRQSPQMALNRGRNSDANCVVGRSVRPLGLSASAWPTLQHAKQQQQQNQLYGSSMRAVFLNNPSGRRECSGTGVFLPRRVDSPPEPRKKPACSTVLVPTRVAQALNLNLDDMMGGQPQHLHRYNASSNMENVGVPRLRSNYVLSQQKRNLNKAQPAMNHEIRLPQEWTY
ncbi:uncharacterized protein LOC113862773 [Abrus precatorius]|uniref:Uncharacterized protein LOC113862773 n=1 Tax=Abrus precatorius TaxID=3816 RepID=A0A8B8L6C6_ABRPR|nr:uncharacterized protein LOC113862773 [Abrus precatorius]